MFGDGEGNAERGAPDLVVYFPFCTSRPFCVRLRLYMQAGPSRLRAELARRIWLNFQGERDEVRRGAVSKSGTFAKLLFFRIPEVLKF